MKMQDVKMTDQVAGHENDGPSKSWGVKMQDMTMWVLQMLDTKIDGVKNSLFSLKLPGASSQRCNLV